ncbi:hypothetical protein [Halalkalicoccus tibetensis]|uniref:Uncharacterized protein n=1 Tax=Halalkalicoccus tibetensis TaxID=175632 RepID=A0ABD5VDB5_9EURY
MKHHEEFNIPIPADEGGMIGRQCPRCARKFEIEEETYLDQGYTNLRCPYCELIAELDAYFTEEQIEYVYGVTQEQGRRIMEEVIESTLGEVPEVKGDFIEFTHNFDDVDLGTVGAESPHLSIEMDTIECDECGFRYAVEEGRTGVCPVCR